MRDQRFETHQLPRFPWRLALFLLASFLVSAPFLIWPELDLLASGLFHDGENFPASMDSTVRALRHGVEIVGTTGGVMVLVALILHLGMGRRLAVRNGRVLVFLLVSLALGPGLIVNTLFKENWGRARPSQVEQFTADDGKRFTPAWVPSDQCAGNCSFVSGDVSIAFWFVAFALPLRNRRWRRVMLGFAMGFGLYASLLRLGMGAHFLSDILLSAVFTVAICQGLYTLLVVWRWPWTWFTASPLSRNRAKALEALIEAERREEQRIARENQQAREAALRWRERWRGRIYRALPGLKDLIPAKSRNNGSAA